MNQTSSATDDTLQAKKPGVSDINSFPDSNSLEAADKTNDVLEGNLVCDEDELEPEVHARTYIAVIAMSLLNMVQLIALQGPPSAVHHCAMLSAP